MLRRLRHAWVVLHRLCWCVFRWCCDLAWWTFHGIGVGVAVGSLVCVFMCVFLLLLCILSAVSCGPSSLLGPHSGTGLPFLLGPVAALLSLVVLPFAAGLHLPTAALSSSVLLVVAVAGLLLLSSLLDMGDPLPLP